MPYVREVEAVRQASRSFGMDSVHNLILRDNSVKMKRVRSVYDNTDSDGYASDESYAGSIRGSSDSDGHDGGSDSGDGSSGCGGSGNSDRGDGDSIQDVGDEDVVDGYGSETWSDDFAAYTSEYDEESDDDGGYDDGDDGQDNEGGADDDEDDDDDDDEDERPRPRIVFQAVAEYPTYDEALLALNTRNEFVYLYDTRYIGRRVVGKTFVCSTHVNCWHKFKIRSFSGTNPRHELMEGGQHTSVDRGVVRHGIDPVHRQEADRLLRLGYGGKSARVSLLESCRDDQALTDAVPSVEQLNNRNLGGWEMTTYASLHAWAAQFLCQDRQTFDKYTNLSSPRMDDLIVLDTFETQYMDEGTPRWSFGVICTSRRLFRNIRTCVSDQGDELFVATDGTYKLHFGGWTLVDCGSQGVVYDRHKYVHRFLPWACMFVRSESTGAYTRMFETIVRYASLFLECEVNAKFGSLDHSQSIANAFMNVWENTACCRVGLT